jgi:2-amino-4-hydroxy-6-hydroxymethyldihydropteridine diphosphokinase
MSDTTRGYLGLGSNIGERAAMMQDAVYELAKLPGMQLIALSSIYESPPWGFKSPNNFYNAVAEITWAGEPLDLLLACQKIEMSLGRQRTRPAGQGGYIDRPIDIDILWLEGIELQGEILMLPHMLAHRRSFVLIPWQELAPEFKLQGRRLSWWIDLLPEEEKESISRVTESKLQLPQTSA